MVTPTDPFAQRFDSIEIDPARAPSQAAIDHALSMCAVDEEPGFYLVNDAGGRFIVDREMGVVALKDEALLTREHGAIYDARLRVVEPSGATYELELKLRLTGAVPQVVGAEEFGFLADMATATVLTSAPSAISPAPSATTPAVSLAAWSRYAAAHAAPGKADLVRTRRTFIAPEFPTLTAQLTTTQLALGEDLPALGAKAPWSL